MTEQPNNEFLKKLVNGEPPQVISTSAADISISFPDKAGGEREYIFPATTPSVKMAISTSVDVTTALKVSLPPDYQQRLVEGIEEVKATRVEEISIKLGPLGAKIKFAPQKTIKRYIEQQKDSGQ